MARAKSATTFLIVVIGNALLMSFSFSQKTTRSPATITKVVNDVEFRSSVKANWEPLTPETLLKQDDEVRTKKNSFLGIVLAGGSKILVRESSIVALLGDVDVNGIRVQEGNVAFDLKQQDAADFRIEWPSAVALVRRAEGGFDLDPKTGKATLNLGPGTARISSTKTNCTSLVEVGHSATIDSTGCVESAARK